MPDLAIRKRLLAIVVVGVVFACAGLGQVAFAQSRADWDGARLFLLIGWLILMPVFVYLMRLRGTARRTARERALARKQALEHEIAGLRTPEGIRAIGNAPPAGPTDPEQG